MKKHLITLTGKLSLGESSIVLRPVVTKELKALHSEFNAFLKEHSSGDKKPFNPIYFDKLTEQYSVQFTNKFDKEGIGHSTMLSALMTALSSTFKQGLKLALQADITITLVFISKVKGEQQIGKDGELIFNADKSPKLYAESGIYLIKYTGIEGDYNVVKDSILAEMQYADSLTRSLSSSSLPKRTSDSIFAAIKSNIAETEEEEIPEEEIAPKVEEHSINLAEVVEEHSVNLAEIAEEPKTSKKK